MNVIDLSTPDLGRLRRALSAARRACERFLDEGRLELAQLCTDLQREIRAEIETREAANV